MAPQRSKNTQMQCSKFHMILRSRGKKREISITILPKELIFNILILLSAELLHNVMRYVCRQWHSIIQDPHFVTAHRLLSATTLLMYQLYHPQTSIYRLLDTRDCRRAKLTACRFRLPHTEMINTCNGLMLNIRELSEPFGFMRTYYVRNPVTRKVLELPQLSLPTFPYHSCLAFEASSNVYKVVVVYRTENYSPKTFNRELGCAVLTVGVDEAWRVVNCAHLEKQDMEVLMLRRPVTSAGLVYWGFNMHRNVVVLDIKSESIKAIILPYAYGTINPYLPKGNSISIWYSNSDCSMEAWLLKDHVNEEWVKILYIDGEPIRNLLDKPFPFNKLYPTSGMYTTLSPVCWFGNDERILFHVGLGTSYFLVYDVKTSSCSWFTLEKGDSSYSKLVPIVSSLAWVC